ncbi:MAG: hypothetical protein AAB657_01245 [Patescibacteria group bacterium]
MQIESKQQILERRKNIEQEIINTLKEIKSDFSLADVQNIIYHEQDNDDMTKVISIFDCGGDIAEMNEMLELASDAWNYFPHKVLGGISPAEVLLEYQNKQEK